MAKKVAEQLVEMLIDSGIKRIYAVTGDSLNEVNDAVRRSGKIDWIHVRHEEAGAYAAAAEAELEGLACCAGSSGPGHVHLINGLYDAHRSGAPVIAIASTCPSGEFGTDFFQETNTIKLFDDCSSYNVLASTPVQFPRMMQQALQHAYHRKGVAVIGLPGDVAGMEAEESVAASGAFPGAAVMRPSYADLQTFADMVNSSKKTTIFCGIGCRHAHDEVVALADKVKAPVGYSFRGKMYVQHHNPNEVGMTGLLGLPSAYHAMQECDLLILLGTDFPYTNFLPKHCKIIQVDVKPEVIGRRAKVTLGLGGTVKDTIQGLLPLLNEKKDDEFLKNQLDFYAKVKKAIRVYVDDPGDTDLIHPEYVCSVINELAADNAIFTVDTGMSCVWGARYLDATGKREMLGSFNHGSMANAMPQAIGAALARPDQQIIALCGDGGLSMLLGDLSTIKQYNLPVKLIVFNNRSLGMVKLEMEVGGLPDWQTDMPDTDFAAIAEAMGIKGFTAHTPREARTAIGMALATEGPALVNILTDPNALAMPPKATFDQMKGFAVSMTKMMFNGKVDEVIAIIKSNYKHIAGII
ncbi:pyruvate dehydrogenase (quinone) [Arcticibacter tournemirensis]|uniref:Ubiquinone-dependent pyruvate dehydrogenase n=1 Tax=Arcticibacter tournemirensis TaxID=699437 RepID=A0A5M9H9R7_9SPHI|nr:thiamine pyrophosphate-dependent enzyme [Arcticibacter tournemirensis]KAA8483400.1 ubiquinone-dependent pyruvate dehydrogenase [Arcticibacter tournemirensis]TQM50908.1 pyruvate dehydrogenase (quinone) [Arcticibacter tournemirensis]